MKRWLVACALVLVLGIRGSASVVAQEATPSTGDDLASLVLSPDAPAYGLSYHEWTARFAQWRHSLPMAIDPSADPTGERCGSKRSTICCALSSGASTSGLRSARIQPIVITTVAITTGPRRSGRTRRSPLLGAFSCPLPSAIPRCGPSRSRPKTSSICGP